MSPIRSFLKTQPAAPLPNVVFPLSVLLLSCLWVGPPEAIAASAPSGRSPGWSDAKNYGAHTVPKEARWADAAFEFLRAQDCRRASFANTRDCEFLVHLPKNSISVHVASTSPYGRYQVVLPDERLNNGHSHDVIVVLDMLPGVSFGHLVLVFYLDTRLSRASCSKNTGMYLENGECLQLTVRRRCKNVMELRRKKRHFAKRCEINFLPKVHLDTDKNPGKKNQLRCRDDIPGFHACAELRHENETSRLVCAPNKGDSQACSPGRGSVRTSCKVFEICDQAVIISGGWNRETSGVSYARNVADMYLLLRRNGFKRKHIKVFYANGVDGFEVPGESSPVTAHPSANKMAFRYHILRMCASPHCVDSLVLYVTSPMTHDGTILLWDVNGDGLAAASEKYTIKEFLSDLQDCLARQIQIIVDGSYAGELVHAIKQSSRHGNVLVMSSGRGYEYSHGHEFTQYWSALTDTRACTTDAFWKINKKMARSSPMISNKGNIKRTLSGAPCSARHSFSNRELRRDFFGCQSLPTAVWLQRILQQDSGETLKALQFA